MIDFNGHIGADRGITIFSEEFDVGEFVLSANSGRSFKLLSQNNLVSYHAKF